MDGSTHNIAFAAAPALEPGEHSHRCPKCGTFWKHRTVHWFEDTAPIEGVPEPTHQCPTLGCLGIQSTKFEMREDDGRLKRFDERTGAMSIERPCVAAADAR